MLKCFPRLIFGFLGIILLLYLSSINAETQKIKQSQKNEKDVYRYSKSAVLRPTTTLNVNRAVNDADYLISFSSLFGKDHNHFQKQMKATRIDNDDGTDGDTELWQFKNNCEFKWG